MIEQMECGAKEPRTIDISKTTNSTDSTVRNWRDMVPMEQELVILCTGPRGSHKSLVGALLSIGEMRAGIPVWSILPVDTDHRFTDIPRLQTKELDLIKLYSMGKDLEEGADYFLDEYDKICAARWTAQSNINRVLDWLGTQLRKFGTSFILTAQNYWHIDPMWRDQIDIVLFCKDMFHTAWGKRKGLVRGELAYVVGYDKSGFLTGKENDPFINPYAEPMNNFYVQARPLWGLFDTKKALGIEVMFRRLQIIKDKIPLGRDGIIDMNKEYQPTDGSQIPKSPIYGPRQVEYIKSLLTKAASQGRNDMSVVELQRLLNVAGMEIGERQLGAILKQVLEVPLLGRHRLPGTESQSTFYDISSFEKSDKER